MLAADISSPLGTSRVHDSEPLLPGQTSGAALLTKASSTPIQNHGRPPLQDNDNHNHPIPSPPRHPGTILAPSSDHALNPQAHMVAQYRNHFFRMYSTPIYDPSQSSEPLNKHYLQDRLDAAERLLGLLLSSPDPITLRLAAVEKFANILILSEPQSFTQRDDWICRELVTWKGRYFESGGTPSDLLCGKSESGHNLFRSAEHFLTTMNI